MLYLVTAPSSLPVSLAETKTFLKVDDSSEDSLITMMIGAATGVCEEYTGRAFISQTWEKWIDGRPSRRRDQWWDGVRDLALSELNEYMDCIELRKPPVQSITSIKSYNLSNTESTFSSAKYFLDEKSVVPRACLKHGEVWPTDLRARSSIAVQFVAGYGDDDTDVPDDIRNAILIQTASLYENRGDSSCGLNKTSQTLLNPHRMVRI